MEINKFTGNNTDSSTDSHSILYFRPECIYHHDCSALSGGQNGKLQLNETYTSILHDKITSAGKNHVKTTSYHYF